MYRNILVPLDGSALAERALPYAEALARQAGARLRLVQAAWARAMFSGDWAKSQTEAVKQAEAYLCQVARGLAERQLTVETAVVFGEAAGVILDEVATHQADLVVMATHGRSGLGRWLYGSVAKAVLVRSPVPVLLVRAWETNQPIPELGARPRLLVPLDGSSFAESALPVAKELAESIDGVVVLFQAISRPEHAQTADGKVVAYVDQQLAGARAEASEYLRDAAKRLGLGARNVVMHVQVNTPASAIARAGEDLGTAFVVMATHGRTGLSRLLMGSVAGEVLRHGRVPLLLIRPPVVRARYQDVA